MCRQKRRLLHYGADGVLPDWCSMIELLRSSCRGGRDLHTAFAVYRHRAGIVSDNSANVFPAALNASGDGTITNDKGGHYSTAFHHLLSGADQPADRIRSFRDNNTFLCFMSLFLLSLLLSSYLHYFSLLPIMILIIVRPPARAASSGERKEEVVFLRLSMHCRPQNPTTSRRQMQDNRKCRSVTLY